MDMDTQNESAPVVPLKRKHYHPDEIANGKPKYTTFKMRRIYQIFETASDNPKDKEGNEVCEKNNEDENCLDKDLNINEEEVEFDREHPERLKLPNDKDMNEEKQKEENKVFLNMMADLQTETLVLIGDSRLNPTLEAEHLKKMKEWEDWKKKYNITKWVPKNVHKPKKLSPKNTIHKSDGSMYASIFKKANFLSKQSSGKSNGRRGNIVARSPRKTLQS